MIFWRDELFYHPATASHRPLVASSACLLGEPVRYNGSHKLQSSIENWLAPWLQLEAICPEVGIGLAVPRPALKLVQHKQRLRVIGERDETLDVTDSLRQYAIQHQQKVGEFWPLCAWIFKARSPSCGVDSSPVNPGSATEHRGPGAFAGQIVSGTPWLPVYEEEDLQDEDSCTAMLLLSYLARDILWQRGSGDAGAMEAHYQDLLGQQEQTLSTENRLTLWQNVKSRLDGRDNKKRRELIEQYRAT